MSAPFLPMAVAMTRLVELAAVKRAARSEPINAERYGAFTLSRISDWPEPSEDWKKADADLKAYASELFERGGMDLMVEVFDRTAERHGWHAVQGVSASWDQMHGWYC